MILSSQITSERGKTLQKTGNEYILVDLSVNRQIIGQIELYYYNDSKERTYAENGITSDEWLLKWRPAFYGQIDEGEDWQIIAQDNTQQIKSKSKRIAQ